MNRIFAFLFIILCNSAVLSQTSQVGWVSKFGLAGGFTPIWMIPNFDEINSATESLNIPDFSNSGFLAYGGSGYAYIMFIDNIRVGGIGFGGSTSQSKGNNEIVYGIGGGALTIEYTIPQINRIAVSLGVMLGAGSVEIDIYQNNGSFSWSDTWSDFNNPDKNIENNHRKLYNSYFSLSPTLNIDIPFTRFLAFRIGAGYQLTFGNDWKADNDITLKGVPSDLNGNSFFIQSGLFLGFFAF